MLRFRRNSLLRPLCGAFLLVAACDEADDTEDAEFRFQTNQCVNANSGTQTIKFGGSGHGPVSPLDPDDGDPWMPLDNAPEAWVDALQQDFRGMTEAFLVADFESDGRVASCPRTCERVGFVWEGGGGCVATAEFAYSGLDYAEPTYEGSPRYRMNVHANVQMGCVCSEP